MFQSIFKTNKLCVYHKLPVIITVSSMLQIHSYFDRFIAGNWSNICSGKTTADLFEKRLKIKSTNRNRQLKRKIWSRSSMILPNHIGKEFEIYNGKSWISVKIIKEMLGHKFGEFSSTRHTLILPLQDKVANIRSGGRVGRSVRR